MICLEYALIILAQAIISTNGFFAPTRVPHFSLELSRLTHSSTKLEAVPIMIIGPILKKRQEEERKKNMPMVSKEEAANEAPGLRVGRDTWKWPSVWPYDESFFVPAATEPPKSTQNNINTMASMLSGVAQVPVTPVDDEESGQVKFDPIQYWNDLHSDTKAALDPASIEKLKKHFSFYLKDGMSILEFGAAEDSYLPDDLKPSRHVGVSASLKQMERNPVITETLQVDLNKVVKDRDIDNDDLRRLAQEPFDAIVMTNTVEYLAHPREVFRSAWYLLKPGGIMLVPFSGKEATKDLFTEARTKMWRDYNDDQHMWITGSFFQFTASDGWENLLGFALTPDSDAKDGQNPILSFLNKEKKTNLYVIQATKAYQSAGIDPDDVEKSIGSLSWMLPVLEPRDKGLLLPRLARVYETAENDEVRDAIERNIPLLPKIYEVLIKMDTFAFTLSMQSQLATNLISDPDFTGSEEQMNMLKQGLGLRTPSPEFWVPVGQNTANMNIEDRISLLGYIVPRVGSRNADQEDALAAFVTGLAPTYAMIRNKCPELDSSDVELLGTELLATEVLTISRSTREEFAVWIAALQPEELLEMLSLRKSIRETAQQELAEYKSQIAEEKRQMEEYRKKYDEQIKRAREERTLYFNPKTQKMEMLEKKKK